MKIRVVEVLSGRIIEPAHISGDRFWLQDEMERPGRPKSGAAGRPIGIRKCASVNASEWQGEYAVLDASREEIAEVKRAEIDRLHAKLQGCRADLFRLYESPLKFEATIRLTATRTLAFEATTLAEAEERAQQAAEASYEDYPEEDWEIEEVQIKELKPRSQ